MEAGKVLCTADGCFRWTIDNFITKAWYRAEGVRSTNFIFSGGTYYMNVRLNRIENLLSLALTEVPHSPSHRVYVSLGMRTGCKGRIETRSEEKNGQSYVGFIWMQCSELMERRCDVMPDGRLQVFCELRRLEPEENVPLPQVESPNEDVREENKTSESDSDDEETVPEYKTLKKLQKDFMNMFLSRDDCDVTIKVQSKEFPAHRNILRARSPVFRSMFSHEMAERLSGEVVIDDCDPGTFPDFLNYLYTGSTKHISGENVCHLYTVSDKYQVEELKEECAAFMKSNLSVATFCDVLTLALQHVDKDLIGLSTEFFCAKATEITKTAKWQTFLHENTTAGNELIIKLLSGEKGFLNRSQS